MASLPAANLLSKETSPYLLKHKDNPVHWRAWSAEALADAKADGKPIYLSSGYASCHWCSTMERESFQDAETAALLNANFVCIKVDKEERPDIDLVYQSALQGMGQSGGWPLNMFLTPEAEPYAGGTYFPKEERPDLGRRAFKAVLNDVLAAYNEKRDQVDGNVRTLRLALTNAWSNDRRIEGTLSPAALEQAGRRICQQMDVFSGGMLGQPKFANVALMDALWRASQRSGAPQFQRAVELQLATMCQGGIYDHLGGGFHRYSVDEFWMVPHFEKVLSDNALMIELLTTVWQETRNPLYKSRIEETIGWAQREMLTPDGAFASALDAETDGVEGAKYSWTAAEIQQVLSADDAKLFRAVYDVRDDGNWNGRNVLHRLRAVPVDPAAEGKLNGMRQKLAEARSRRAHPARDDKVLADWNGMMIRALTHAAEAFNRLDWQAMAVRAFWFVAERMAKGNRLTHSFRAGQPGDLAFLDDYAWMIRAALTLHETTGDKRYLALAQSWTGELDSDFWDPVNGGYAVTAASADPLFVRPRHATDGATVSGNAISAMNLANLFYLTGEQHYRDRTNALIQSFSRDALANISAHGGLYNALDTLYRAIQIVIVGERQTPDTNAMRDVLRRSSMPTRMMLITPATNTLHATHPAYGKPQLQGRATVYVCNATTCSNPITDPNQLELGLKTRAVNQPQTR
ncbi:MAG TPA: thioredoxin domain-containing protein [Alphaproteobacteria bacterium]|nr:thioredoxin domain-containing protein [Alphaproteobacteria bacterium]